MRSEKGVGFCSFPACLLLCDSLIDLYYKRKMEDPEVVEAQLPDWKLPQKFWIYKKQYQLLVKSRQLFSLLLVEYQLCVKCIFRIYSFEHPKIYNDPQFLIQILPTLISQEELSNYNPHQCCNHHFCWLCQSLFQKQSVNTLLNEIKQEIKSKGLEQYSQFKLNVRIPNIILLRNVILSRYLYHEFSRSNIPVEKLSLYNQILIYPFDTGKFVDPKAVMKWILSFQLNSNTNMTSTADDHPQNLVISLEFEHNDTRSQSALVTNFRGHLGLEKKKEKTKYRKQCLDLGNETQDYKCNANNLNKILNLKQPIFENVVSKITNISSFWQFINGNQQQQPLSQSSFSQKVTLMTKHVYLCGKYIKFSRYLSQTPWMVNGKKLTQGSLQQEIQDRIFSLFYPNKLKQEIQSKFHAGGRQDIDVRMLKGGRPFVLEFVNPIRQIKNLKQENIIASIPESNRDNICKSYKEWISSDKIGEGKQFHSWRIVKLLEIIINTDNPYVQVSELQQTTESFISVELKAAQMEKIKHYLCYIHSPSPFTHEDSLKVAEIKDLSLQQLTPLRVLHRRTLMTRDKTIHSLKMHLVSRHSAILEVWASAGTYIKEFVHGDLGITLPNVGSILGKEVDILQLDVGSLKEGEWVKGDELQMKLEKQQWMQ